MDLPDGATSIRRQLWWRFHLNPAVSKRLLARQFNVCIGTIYYHYNTWIKSGLVNTDPPVQGVGPWIHVPIPDDYSTLDLVLPSL